jgi:beta-1,4-mannosyltransferase
MEGAPQAESRILARVARFPPTTDGNPYQRLLYTHLSEHGFELAPDERLSARRLWRQRRELTHVHLHWQLHRHYRWADRLAIPGRDRPARGPLAWLRAGRFVARLAAARALGMRVVWTLHEIRPKDPVSVRLDRLVARAVARISHVLIAHDAATVDEARHELGRLAERIEVVPHPSYVGIYPPGRPRAQARKALGIPDGAFAFLAFGSVRPYKRTELLLEAFLGIDRNDVVLVVAGAFFDAVAERAVRAAARTDARIRPWLEYVPDAAVAELYAACDAAVLARQDGGTTGSLLLAMSMGLPVVAADRPGYRDLLGDGLAGWLFRPGDTASMRAALEEAASDPPAARAKGAAGLARAERLRWPDVARTTARAMIGSGASA